jgi:dipeptidyl aminopeptidase/acylaminoacyl peptidase
MFVLPKTATAIGAAYRNSPSASPWPGAFELGRPHWVFGMARYGLVSAGSPGDTWLVGGITRGGLDRLVALVPGRPEPVPLASGIDQVASLAVGEASVFAVVGGPKLNNAVVRLSRRTLSDAVLGSLQPDEPEVLTADDGVVGAVSVPRPVSFSVAPRRVAGGRDPVATAHGLLYLPNPAIDRELAPLVVMIHGGPTGVADPQYNPRYQFWTQRGYALLDVNYRGSTGFGRHYRGALNGWWGIADVEDCIAGAQSLVEAGIADPQRLAIRGSSAGGFTVLNTLASSDLFRCGVTLYGVSDPSLLVAETHRFESTYLDSLIAPWPEGAAEYERRSPMARLGSITASVLVFQGEEDRVVPVDQALMLVEGLRARGSHVEYHQFADEAHGFRGPEVQAFVLRRELEFYEQQFAG